MGTPKPGRSVADVLVAAGALAAPGCGSSGQDSSTTTKPAPTVDSSAVEGNIQKKFSSNATTVTKAKCPNDVKSDLSGELISDPEAELKMHLARQ